MKEAIFIDGYYFADDDSDGVDVEITFISEDVDTLRIRVEGKEYTIYGKDRVYELFQRITEIWYPPEEKVQSAD